MVCFYRNKLASEEVNIINIIKQFYQLTKPGIIYGNLITSTGGFLFAANGQINFWLLLEALGGISLIIASACVFNNYIDRGIDRHMARTKNRAIASGRISGRIALLYATILGTGGFILLGIYTNTLTVYLGIIAFFVYVVVYGIAKRRSVHGTIVGSIAGALPPVAGYTAAYNQLDVNALVLFSILTFWQMPHFYSIAIYRLKDYRAARIPVLPAIRGIRTTQNQIVIYVLLFVVATACLTFLGTASYTFLVVLLTIGLIWFFKGLQGFNAPDKVKWARGMFFFSLIVILALSTMLSINAWLP